MFIKTIFVFEMLMDRSSKTSNNLFSRTPIDASECMKKIRVQKGIVAK